MYQELNNPRICVSAPYTHMRRYELVRGTRPLEVNYSVDARFHVEGLHVHTSECF